MPPTDLEQKNRALAPGVVERQVCLLSSLNEISGRSVSERWNVGRGQEQNESGIATRSENLVNLEKIKREDPGDRAPGRDDVRKEERAKRRSLKRRVYHADYIHFRIINKPFCNIISIFLGRESK